VYLTAQGRKPAAREEMTAPPAAAGPLRLGVQGECDGESFVVVGRTVLAQGNARWSEWALRLKSGTVHFVSDAQGALHLLKASGTREGAPSPATLAPGQRLEMKPGEVFHVRERGESTLVAAEGELPFEARAGTRIAFSDLQAVGGALATLEWRDGLEHPPELWDGYPTSARDLGLPDGTSPATTVQCSACGKEQALRLGSLAVTYGCPHCLQLTTWDGGTWRDRGVQRDAHSRHPLRLGLTGRLRGEQLTVVGVMARSCVVDGDTYPWKEYLCVADGLGRELDESLRWLVEQDGHWSIIRPLSRGDVTVDGQQLRYGGEAFKEFSTVRGTVDFVVGEQPYIALPGDSAVLSDHVCPPRLISVERTSHEETWTLGEYVTRQELADAFPNAGELAWPEGVAPNQPNRALHNARWMVCLGALFWAVVLLVFLGVWRGARHQLVFEAQLTPAVPLSTEAGASADSAFYSQPISITAHNRNVSVEVRGDLSNAWETVEVGLIHEESGQVRRTRVPVERWSGIEDGESWSEGSNVGTGFLASVPRGTHVVRVETECDSKPCAPFLLRLRSDEPRPLYAFLVLFLLAVWPILAFAYASYLETRRWMNSTLSTPS
jgi:hypothetical protein